MKRDYMYRLDMGGERFVEGDVHSIGMLFSNFSGANFASPPPWKEQTFEQWIQWMSSHYQRDFAVGTEIRMFSPEGAQLAHERIGAHARREEANSEMAAKDETPRMRHA